MNYGQVRDQVLKLLNQYTIAGNPVDNSYNSQQDYLNRIPALVNDAMMEIATTARKIPAVLELDRLSGEELGQEVRYRLPDNFYQLVSGSAVKTAQGRVLHTNCVSVSGGTDLVLPREEAGQVRLHYYRYPMPLSETPADSDELDNTPETHFAIPFYVAAFLVDHDDPYLCALFQNKYQDKLDKMSRGQTAEIRPTADCYGFYN